MMRMFLAALCLLVFHSSAFAGTKEAQRTYYQEMNVLHKTSYALDYLLHPKNFMATCQMIYPKKLDDISKNDLRDVAAMVDSLVKPIRAQVQENERAETLALINRLYLNSKPENGIDYDRFFAVYLNKAQKSREIIAHDMVNKTPEFSKFLKFSKVLTLDKCRDRMQNIETKSLRSFWPDEAGVLREELDNLLGKTLLPDAYKTAYRRLLR